MTTPSLDDPVPRVWIGCIAPHNAGYLIGHWLDAVGANAVTLADVHKGSARGHAACEELWCLDHEHLPVRVEMRPHEASRLGEAFEEVGVEHWPALCA